MNQAAETPMQPPRRRRGPTPSSNPVELTEVNQEDIQPPSEPDLPEEPQEPVEDIDVTMQRLKKHAVQSALAKRGTATPADFQEPEFDEKAPESPFDPPNQYDELLGKVYKRKDKPESKKRYEPVHGFAHFDGIDGIGKKWMLEVAVFIYTEDKGKDGKMIRKSLAVKNSENSLHRPSAFMVEAETFKRFYELAE